MSTFAQLEKTCTIYRDNLVYISGIYTTGFFREERPEYNKDENGNFLQKYNGYFSYNEDLKVGDYIVMSDNSAIRYEVISIREYNQGNIQGKKVISKVS